MEPCIQAENIGALKEAAGALKDAVVRLDARINGTFKQIGEHISEAPDYRSKIKVLENEVKNIKEEKNNTTKASQWRVGLIVGLIPTAVSLILHFWK